MEVDSGLEVQRARRSLGGASWAGRFVFRGHAVKKPWIAVLLNAIPLILGVGYLYLGLWRRFLIVFGLQVLAGFVVARAIPAFAGALTLLWLLSMHDVYKQAKQLAASGAERQV